jgi:hypothetical protein
MIMLLLGVGVGLGFGALLLGGMWVLGVLVGLGL